MTTSSPGHVLVVGAGVQGAASAVELRKRGWDVTLLDRGPLPNEGASSTDVSKLVRMDYGSDVFYHRLADAALEGWDRWNREWPRRLYHEDGLLVVSPGGMRPGDFEHESRRVLAERGYDPEPLTSAAIRARFPAWSVDPSSEAYLSHRAGWAESGQVVERLLEIGAAAGARWREGSLASLLDSGSRVSGVVTREGDRISADRVVVCAGAWTPTLLPWLSDRMWAVGQPVLYFRPADPRPFRAPHFPPWLADIANSGWYGFPAHSDGLVKVGHHGNGSLVHPDHRGVVPREHVERARDFLSRTIPALSEAPVADRRVCLYCDTFDGDFLIDRDPDREGLVIAAGGSGHGFKFAPLVGGMIADALEGRPGRWGERFQWRAPGPIRTEAARFTGDY